MWEKPKKKLGYDTTNHVDEIECAVYREENTASFKLEVLGRATQSQEQCAQTTSSMARLGVERGIICTDQTGKKVRKARNTQSPLIT
jgi:hypothetical protein